jgi:hypothetical protein
MQTGMNWEGFVEETGDEFSRKSELWPNGRRGQGLLSRKEQV